MGDGRQAGRDADLYLDFAIGQRVQTKEGFPGVIDDIQELPGSATYYVTLDNGMGGGQYGPSEVAALPQQQASVERTAMDDYPELGTILHDRPPLAHEVPADSYMGGRVTSILHTATEPHANRYVEQHGESQYTQFYNRGWRRSENVGTIPESGADGDDAWMDGYLDSAAGREKWHLRHCTDPNYHETCPEVTSRQGVLATSDEARDWNDAGAHEDMEGEEYLDPPYPEDEALAAQGAAWNGNGGCFCCDGSGEHSCGHECYVCDGSGDEIARDQVQKVCEGHHGRSDPERGDYYGDPHRAAIGREGAMIPAMDWAFDAQKDQYPDSGPEGVSYFKGVINASMYVDCLLYFQGGQLVGILNRFPKAMGPEKKNNINIFVSPAHQRQGIGSALLGEAIKRWNIDPMKQDHTPAGLAMTKKFLGKTASSIETVAASEIKAGDTLVVGMTDSKARVTAVTEQSDGWLLIQFGKGSSTKVTPYQEMRRQADLYLPPQPNAGPVMLDINHPLTGQEDIGYRDGFNAATSQAMREPTSLDPDYRAGYNLGWAAGVEHIAPEGDGMPMTTEDLEARLSRVQAGGLWNLIKGEPTPNKYWEGPGHSWSFDWCRYRRNSRCFYPKVLNEEATKLAGYSVWVPEDRGQCTRVQWDDQKTCPVGMPGPHVPGGYTDATVPWEEGGQRGAHPKYVATREAALDATKAEDPDFRWHVTASWADVRKKAKRIRQEGGVRILSAMEGQVTGQVKGDTNVYQTTLVRVIGRQAIGFWECGCAWGAYSFGRSGRWKRFEGRMCSHALAVQYEAQARGMFGKTVTEDRSQPNWLDPTIPVRTPGSWDRDKQRYTSLRVVEGSYEEMTDEAPPVVLWAESLLSEGLSPTETRDRLVAAFGERALLATGMALTAARGEFMARVRNILVRLRIINGEVVDEAGKPPAGPVIHPMYDPRLGLSLSDHKRASKTAMPVPGVLYYAHRDSGGTSLIKRELTADSATYYYWNGQDWVEDNTLASITFFGSSSAEVIDASEVEDVKAEVARGRTSTLVVTGMSASEHAKQLLNASFEEEARLTPMLKQLVGQYGGQMRGLSNRIKGHVVQNGVYTPKGSTVQEKIEARMAQKGISVEKAAKSIPDVLRYTVELPDNRYSDGVEDILSALHDRGYLIMQGKGKNYWKKGDPYDGINCTLYTLAGNLWELQFHTRRSFTAKTENHTPYKVFAKEKDPQKRGALYDQMVNRMASVPIPPGARDISRHFLHDVFEPKAATMAESEWLFEVPLSSTASTEVVSDEWAMAMDGPIASARVVVTSMGADDPWALVTPAAEADLHEQPEPALPATDGANEETARQAVLRALAGQQAPSEADLLAAHNARLAASAEGIEVGGKDPFAHLLAGTRDSETAAAAKDFLARTALADFTPAERAQIIDEGIGVEAGNLDALDIKGTHYEALDNHLSAQDDDSSWLM